MMSSAARPTLDDVKVILKLYRTRREARMREARRWFVSSFKVGTLDEFNATCPPNSEPHASYRMVVTYWEMVASFLTFGTLNKELFFQSGRELLLTWERIRDVLPSIRQATSNPLELKNLETIAGEYIDWLNRQAPGSYEAFSKRVRAR
jgi:hypothetical protein